MDSDRFKLIRTSRATQAIAAALVSAGVISAVAVSVEAISVDRVDAIWAVNDEVGESSQVIPIRAAHPDCPSWSRLGGLVVHAVETDEAVTITATFPEHATDVVCNQKGSAMRATVKLDRPLGDRVVVDGGSGLDPATPLMIAFYTGDSPGSPG